VKSVSWICPFIIVNFPWAAKAERDFPPEPPNQKLKVLLVKLDVPIFSQGNRHLHVKDLIETKNILLLWAIDKYVFKLWVAPFKRTEEKKF